MPAALALTLALIALAVAMAAAVARPRWLPEAVAALGGALLLVAPGSIGAGQAWDAIGELAPTVGFLAALLVLAEGCRREGLFDALGDQMAAHARRSPRRLLALTFAAAVAVTSVLSLDATVVFLTPIVLATALRSRVRARPHAYACAHLANSASLLLPVSNLTNLLAFQASRLSFLHFAGLMALPTAGVVVVEWAVLSRFFASDLERPVTDAEPPAHGTARAAGRTRARAAAQPRAQAAGAPARRPLPRFALAVLGATLAGFAASSALGVEPVWVAVAGALAISGPRLLERRVTPVRVAAAAEPGFLAFVLGLGVIVAAAGDNGLADAVRAVVPAGDSLPDLLLIAACSALLANLVNNLPATLILVPVVAAAGPVPLLAALIGVNVGPNATYVGSLATLLWRRVLHRHDHDPPAAEFLRLGALTVPAGLIVATVLLWLAAQWL